MRRALEERLARIEERLERLQLLLMVREPQTGVAADAYEGLRRQVVASASERTAHLAQLARLDSEVSGGASPESVERLLRDLLAESGLEAVTQPNAAEFEIVSGSGNELVLVEAAYIERATGRVVRRGKATAVDRSAGMASAQPAAPAQVVDVPTALKVDEGK
jgi:hypothetical protein